MFREYTEKGRLQAASAIIASQVANLETATRQIENKARTLAKPSAPSMPSTTSMPRQPPLGTGIGTGTGTGTGPPGPPGPPAPIGTPRATPSFVSVASTGTTPSSGPYEWTTVQPKAKPKPKAEKPAKSNRLILVQSVATTELSSLALRNAFNKAFVNKGVAGPVVATVSRTLGRNIVVSTTSQFSADYLLENQPIWEHLVPFKLAQKDEPWHKVVLHGIPIAD